MNWTLLAVLLILGICALIGAIKGLIRILFHMLALVIIIVATSIIAPNITPALKENTGWYEKLSESTGNYLDDNGVLLHPGDMIEAVLPKEDDADTPIKHLLIPEGLKTIILLKAKIYAMESTDAYNSFVIKTVSDALFSAIVYAIVFAAVSLVVLILWIIMSILSKLPVIRTVNRLAGGLAGVGLGVIIVWIVFVIVAVFSRNGLGTFIGDEIHRNVFLSFLYDTDPLLFLIYKFVV